MESVRHNSKGGHNQEVGRGNSFRLGNGPELPKELFRKNRERLVKKLTSMALMGIVFLEGGSDPFENGYDFPDVFQQESFFYWLFGVVKPGYYGAIDVTRNESYLFYPNKGFGSNEDEDKFQRQLKENSLINFTFPTNRITETLTFMQPKYILVLFGKSRGSYKEFRFMDKLQLKNNFELDFTQLYPIICEIRSVKTEEEISLIRYTAGINSRALTSLVHCLTAGMSELKAVALFSHYVSSLGACRSSSSNYCVTSSNVGRLWHFLRAHSYRTIGTIPEGDMCILDMSCSYFGYYSTVSVTYPISGQFDSRQEKLYKIVLSIREKIYSYLGFGVTLNELNKLGEKALLSHLKFDLDILRNPVEELLEARLQDVFMPQACCHFVGLERKDVGEDDVSHYFKSGKCPSPENRNLQVGVVLAVGPGCYFIDDLIDKAISDQRTSKYIQETVEQFRDQGAVRLKDMVLITEQGYEIISDVPREIEEVEELVATFQNFRMPCKPCISTNVLE